MIETEARTLLRGASSRVTRPRVAVLSAVHEVPHADVSTLLDLVRKRIGAVSAQAAQAVHDVLGTLVEAGPARRIDLPDSPARCEGQARDGHQHVVCRACGVIAGVEGPRSPPRPDAPRYHGFAIDHVEVTYRGMCPVCRPERGQGGPESVN